MCTLCHGRSSGITEDQMGLWSFYVCLILCFASATASIPDDGNITLKHSDRRGKALKISKKPCMDPNGRKGVCTFKWDCINRNGTLMGTCVDGFIFGTCCQYDYDLLLHDEPSHLPSYLDTNKIVEDHRIIIPQTTTTTSTRPTTGRTTTTTTTTTSTTTRLPAVTTPRPTSVSVASTSQQQLVTWTSIGPTRRPFPQRPIIIQPFPFRPGTNFPTLQGGWPMGVAFPVDPFQINRPLQVFRPPILMQSAQNNVANKVPVNHVTGSQVPANPAAGSQVTANPAAQFVANIVSESHFPAGGNVSYTIFNGADRTTQKTASNIEMTTISVPIPQWSTQSAALPSATPSSSFGSTVRPLLLVSGNLSTAAESGLSSTGRPLRNSLDYRKDCGVRSLGPKARIVGGQSTPLGRWPWQVLVKEAAWLGLYQKNKCGGVLVSARHAITAGHCQPGRFLSALVVILGEYDLLSDTERLRPEVRRVKRMIVHRHYNPQNFDNDIAVLELDPPVLFRPHISPICLPDPGEDFTGRMAYVTGWGKTSHGGSIPNLLQEVQVPIMSNGQCVDMFKEAGHAKLIKETFLCAGYKTGGKDSCEGDSGGPLMIERNTGQWVLVGTVSHGIRCADPNLPGVYMRISAYRSWIDKIIQ